MLYQLSHVRVRVMIPSPRSGCAAGSRTWPVRCGSAPRMAEAARPPVAAGQRLGGDETGHPDGDDDELGDPVSPADGVGLTGIGVDEDDLDLAAVARVDEPRGVEARHAVADRQAAAGEHQPGVAGGNCDRQARRDERPPTGGPEDDVLRRDEVGAGVPGMRVGRCRRVPPEGCERDVEHRGRVAPPAAGTTSGEGARTTIQAVLVWMDLEMTGLDPSHHVIVEIATLVTDDELEIVAEGPDLVVGAMPEDLAKMDEVVRKMHTESGLLSAIESSVLTLADAGAATLEFIRVHVPQPRRVPLCGNSIGVDRRFLSRHLPEIEEYLHYRSIDVSTVKELCKRWYPTLYQHAPKKAGSHRALDDIRESVTELRYYRDNFFRLPDDKPQGHA